MGQSGERLESADSIHMRKREKETLRVCIKSSAAPTRFHPEFSQQATFGIEPGQASDQRRTLGWIAVSVLHA